MQEVFFCTSKLKNYYYAVLYRSIIYLNKNISLFLSFYLSIYLQAIIAKITPTVLIPDDRYMILNLERKRMKFGLRKRYVFIKH